MKGFCFPGSWVSLCLPFRNLPKAMHLLPSVHTTREKKSGCHFCELVTVERRGKMMQSPDKGFGRWGWGGLTRGRLQGSPAPRQMCLGVTSHPQRNESADRCLTSRLGCHTSRTRAHTHTHTAQHTHTEQFITLLGRVAQREVTPRRWCPPRCNFDQTENLPNPPCLSAGKKNPVMRTKYTHTNTHTPMSSPASTHCISWNVSSEKHILRLSFWSLTFTIWKQSINIERHDKRRPRCFCGGITDSSLLNQSGLFSTDVIFITSLF